MKKTPPLTHRREIAYIHQVLDCSICIGETFSCHEGLEFTAKLSDLLEKSNKVRKKSPKCSQK